LPRRITVVGGLRRAARRRLLHLVTGQAVPLADGRQRQLAMSDRHRPALHGEVKTIESGERKNDPPVRVPMRIGRGE
jgi:hypothetical protein